jgi:hypothetical protein
MLVKIADLADDEGRNAWPEVPRLMKYCRTSERATQYVLRRLERDREIDIEYNEGRRAIVLKGGRLFRPKWFIHVRCVCDWEAYQLEGKPATSADSAPRLRSGRPSRKPANLADSPVCGKLGVNPQVSTAKAASSNRKTRKNTSGGSIGIDPVVDPVVRTSAGAAPLAPVEKPVENPEDNIRVIAKIVHEVLDNFAQADDVTEGDVIEAVKRHCAVLDIAYNSAVVWRALDSAFVQRGRKGKPRFGTG